MFEATAVDSNQNLIDINPDSANEAYGLSASANQEQSIGFATGTLKADNFILNSDFQIQVFSGNGNIDYGTGVYDTLDLSDIAVDEIADVSFAYLDEGGVAYDAGNGEKIYDYIVLDDGTEILFEGIESLVFSDNSYDLTINPDDTEFGEQWNLHTVGLQTAWNFTTGSDEVLIGVQDTGLGFDADGNVHEDLRDTDTLFFGSDVNENIKDDFFIGQEPNADLQDNSHGTSVQGVIAAETDNGVGIAGINWNSDVYNIDVLDGNLGDSNLADATQKMIDEAVANDRKLIINMSLGGGDIDPEFEALVANNQEDVLFVIASGNGGDDGISDPALSNPASLAQDYDNVVAVGAVWGKVDSSDTPVEVGSHAEFSNTGEGLTLVAPTDVITTGATYDLQSTEAVLNYNTDFNGTSAAAPHVAGIASLVWSANGELDATQVKEILSNTAYDLGVEGYDLVYGSGMVNADAAVRQAIALGRSTDDGASLESSAIPTIVTEASFDSTDSSFTPTETNSQLRSTGSSDRTNESNSQINLMESNLAELPTSLFDYHAAGMKDIVELNGQMIKEDLFSSPLYAA